MEKGKSVSVVRAVVFDLDGTLVDSVADIAAAVNATLVAHGRPGHSLEAYKTMVGWGLKQLLVNASAERPFDPGALESAYQEVLVRYRALPVVHTTIYPGITSLVQALSTRVPLGVFSNKEDGMTKTIVATLFPGVPFRAVVGARPGKPHKPDPSVLLETLDAWGVQRDECAYLGDSDVDMDTARRAGVVACGAAWGFRGAEELRESGADEVFADADAFRRWLEQRTETKKGVQP